MSDGELIRRGDARKVADEVFDRLEKKGADQAAFGAAEVCEAIAAIPAQGVPKDWHMVEGSLGSILLYTLRQDGWSKGQPLMVNDVMIRIESANGSQTDVAPIANSILAALAPASGGVEATEDVGILRARVDELQRLNADLTRQVQMQPRRPQDAALAAIREGRG